mmetsp:Transcript_10893/g.32644  ORF Transcript_10893/g.32644 Transcript_10893/m.32644 type:complete len:80 (-) Transcript_10893:13-252(-)
MWACTLHSRCTAVACALHCNEAIDCCIVSTVTDDPLRQSRFSTLVAADDRLRSCSGHVADRNSDYSELGSSDHPASLEW